MEIKGIDVATFQGEIEWKKAAADGMPSLSCSHCLASSTFNLPSPFTCEVKPLLANL